MQRLSKHQYATSDVSTIVGGRLQDVSTRQINSIGKGRALKTEEQKYTS